MEELYSKIWLQIPKLRIDISEWAKGTYVLTIENNARVVSRKLIKM
jgi:hypothetical protein